MASVDGTQQPRGGWPSDAPLGAHDIPTHAPPDQQNIAGASAACVQLHHTPVRRVSRLHDALPSASVGSVTFDRSVEYDRITGANTA